MSIQKSDQRLRDYRDRLIALTDGLPSKSAKMRALAAAGYTRAQIADFLGVSYQFVRNVLVREEQRRIGLGDELDSLGMSAAKDLSSSVKIKVGSDGHIVVPTAFRAALGLNEGDILFARLDDGEIHFLTPKAAMRRAQAIVRQFVPEGVSLVDELLEDRRREVEAERG